MAKPGKHWRAAGTMLLAWYALGTAAAWASAMDEARQLKNEAAQILRSASGAAANPKVYAQAVFKLERAEKLLDAAAKSDPKAVEGLQEEVAAALFWARKFTTMQVIREIEKGDPGAAPGGSKAPPPKVSAPPPPKRPSQRPRSTNAASAEQRFRKGEAFERSHQGDDHTIALRWFQVAEQTTGTKWSLRALSHANEAQARYKAKQEAQKAPRPKSEDEKLIAEGNAFFNRKQYAQAIQKYEAARKLKDGTQVRRRIGHTHLEMGYKLRDEYARQYLPLLKRFSAAKRSGNKRLMAQLSRQVKSLVARLRPLEKKAIQHYTDAAQAFQKGLDRAQGKDLDCEGHLAILQFERKRRLTARQRLAAVLQKYQPQNDEERTVYEYCKSLLKLLTGR